MSLSRRPLLAAAGATASTEALAFAVPHTGAIGNPDATGPDAELLAAVAEWTVVRDICNSDPIEYEDDESDPHLMRLFAIEERIASMPPQTVAGFAAKILIVTGFAGHAVVGRPAEVIFGDALAAAPACLAAIRPADQLRAAIAFGQI